MERGVLILLVVLLMISHPSPSRAETHVYVSFSVGGAVVIGAGVVYWSFSYTSQVSQYKPSEQSPDRGSMAIEASRLDSSRLVHLIPQLIAAQEQTRADLPSSFDAPRSSPALELPLLMFRW